jgi:hypothetical protein
MTLSTSLRWGIAGLLTGSFFVLCGTLLTLLEEQWALDANHILLAQTTRLHQLLINFLPPLLLGLGYYMGEKAEHFKKIGTKA